MKDALDFARINQAALAAFPAVLARLLPGGRVVAGKYLALNPAPRRYASRLFQGAHGRRACGRLV